MKYLVTGGSGFLGVELIKRLVARGDKVVALARNEGKLIELKEKIPSVEIVPGDILDPFYCNKVMAGVDGVFHLAAMKHVGLAETHARECVASNVYGTLNVLESSLRYKPGFVLGISTDKAAKVNGVYGATKLLQERLFSEYEKVNPDTKYRTVRYGNVLDSTGSVSNIWRERIKRGEDVVITDHDSTRFYWTVSQAVDLIFECLDKATDSMPYITGMKSIRAGDLLAAIIQKYAIRSDMYANHIKTIGLQPGENMHETVGDGFPDSEHAERYTKEEIMELI